MSETLVLEYGKHSTRLSSLALARKYTLGALSAREKLDAENPQLNSAIEGLVSGFNNLLKATGQEPQDTSELQQVLGDYFHTQIREPARQVLLNFAFVLLCTELEVFIAHLVETVLRVEPRLLKSLASQKNLTTSDIIEAGSYENIIKRIHHKVIKEIIDSSTREMFVTHVGNRLGLFIETEFCWTVEDTKASLAKRGIDSKLVTPRVRRWGLSELEQVFGLRHEIVHEGKLPISEPSAVEDAELGIRWVEAFLTLRAIERYSLTVDSQPLLDSAIMLYGLKERTHYR